MDIFTLMALALGLSMDAFAVSISNSMCFKDLSKKQGLLTSLCFGFFQGVMPVLGFVAGRGFSQLVSAIDHWIALILLGIIGGKMLIEGIKALKEPDNCKTTVFSYKLMITQGIATSIDALAVGISLAALNVNIFNAAAFIGLSTYLLCIVGHIIGKKVGGSLGKKAEILGGMILIFIGAKIFIEHMFM